MDRRHFFLGLGGLALASRPARAEEKEVVNRAGRPADEAQDRGVVPLHGLKQPIHIGETE